MCEPVHSFIFDDKDNTKRADIHPIEHLIYMKNDTKNTLPEIQEEEWTLPVMDSVSGFSDTPDAWTAFAIGAVTKQVNKEREKLIKHLDKV